MGDQVLIFDTTLRDGEQSPGATMTFEQKLNVAALLDEMKVDIIEAGFPAASNGDFAAVEEIARRTAFSTVCALTRANRGDIDRAAEALKPAAKSRIHTFISTSPLHMKYKLQMTPDDVLDAIADSVAYARNLTDDVEWSCEDGTRSEPDFLYRCFDAALKAGANTVNIADTVGYAMPEEFSALISNILNSVPDIDKARFSVHCHDDLGLATANSLAAIRTGARQVECTINGVGERAGNASLEEIVMALRTRGDMMGIDTNVRTELLTELSRAVANATGFRVSPNKAIVGANAFAHESGIHQHGVIQHRKTYEIMQPESVGAGGSKLVMGKHSGRHAMRYKLDALGVNLGDNSFEDLFDRFKELADTQKEVTDQELLRLSNCAANETPKHSLDEMSVTTNQDGVQVRLILSQGGSAREATADAQTSYDAIALAISSLIENTAEVDFVQIARLNESNPSLTRVTLRLISDGRSFMAEDVAVDPNAAYARAFIQGAENFVLESDSGQSMLREERKTNA